MSVNIRRLAGTALILAGTLVLLRVAANEARGLVWQSRHADAFPPAAGTTDRLETSDRSAAASTAAAAGPAPGVLPAGAATRAAGSRVVPAPPRNERNTSRRARAPARPASVRRSPVARLLIPTVGIDIVVAAGTDDDTLRLGPGHMTGSALPGENDNCIIAGHRDGPFRRLGKLEVGDEVEVRGESGPALYRVSSIDIVHKTDTSPLDPSEDPILTLITCYPFNHVGPAPNRLIVRGALVEDDPGSGSL